MKAVWVILVFGSSQATGREFKMCGFTFEIYYELYGEGKHHVDAFFKVVPEDVPMSLIAIYGFSPPIRLGRDHRVGFGFRFGNHADLQLMYEFGPQLHTKPLQPVKVRSASYRVQRRRPLVELLLRAGLLEEVMYDDADIDEPR